MTKTIKPNKQKSMKTKKRTKNLIQTKRRKTPKNAKTKEKYIKNQKQPKIPRC